MKRLASVCMVVALFVAQAPAADPPLGTCKWDGGGAKSLAAGKISASGTYKVANGFKAGTIELNVYPTAGGQITTANGTISSDGEWEIVTIEDLPTGQYTVLTKMVVLDANGKQVATISPPISVVNVK